MHNDIMQYAFEHAGTLKTRTAKKTIAEKIQEIFVGFERQAFEKFLLVKRDLDSILARIYNRFCFQELAAVLFFWNSRTPRSRRGITKVYLYLLIPLSNIANIAERKCYKLPDRRICLFAGTLIAGTTTSG